MLQDLRLALRRIRRSPGFTAAAVLCLALGIGASTAIFTVVNAVLLRPLPFADPDRLVGVWEANRFRRSERNVVSPANYLDWQAENTVFQEMAALVDYTVNLTGDGEPEEVQIQGVTASLFPLLGLTPASGRTFTASEDAPDGTPVVVLSHELWVRRYGADPGILGRAIRLDERPHTVVGVMPAGTQSVGWHRRPALWVPLALDRGADYRETAGRYLSAIARLEPGVPLARAQAEMATIAGRLAEAHPGFNTGWSVNLVPLTDQVVGAVQRPLAVLGGVVLVVLLIACANVANLQLAQATVRQRETAVRAALGAGGVALARQILLESVLVSLAGGALGVFLAWWGADALAALAAAGIPRMEEVTLDLRALAFTVTVSLAAGVAVGIASAARALRGGFSQALREGGRGSSGSGHRARAILVAAQVALSLVLLAGAGLLLKSFARITAVDLGFNPERVLTARVSPSGERYESDETRVRFFEQLLGRVRSVPGVEAAGAVSWLPLSGQRSATDMLIEGEPAPRPGEAPGADVRAVDPGDFQAMQIRLLRGRPIAPTDTRESPRSVVVSQSFVERHLAGRDPVGRRILMEWGDTLVATIVGVVGDVRHTGVDSLPSPTVYWALPQFPPGFVTVVVRAAGDPRRLVPGLTAQVRALDPAQPLAQVKTFDDWLDGALARRRFSLMLLAGFAGLALVLTAVGLYGTTAYGVAQRTREFGIRLALGARAGQVLWNVLRSTLAVVLGGVVVGGVGALAATRLLGAQLYEVSATDPAVFGAIVLLLTVAGGVAGFVPARRAARADPMVALRSE